MMPGFRKLAPVLAAILCAAIAPAAAEESLVTKVAESFDKAAWKKGGYNRAAGSLENDAVSAPDAGDGGSMRVTVEYSGKGFEFFSVEPEQPFVIPGDVREIRLRTRVGIPDYGFKMTFRDGWGRGKVNGKDLEWNVPSGKPGEWTTQTFKVPDAWVMPLTITGFSAHNWGKQDKKNSFPFWVDHLEVVTDVSGVDPETGILAGWTPDPKPADPAKSPKQVSPTPLVLATCNMNEESNVYSRQQPSLNIRIQNWKPGTLKGNLTLTIRDNNEQELTSTTQAVEVDSVFSTTCPIDVGPFGRYHADVVLAKEDGGEFKSRTTFAKLPPWRDLSDQEKDVSPYGVNVHGGQVNLPIVPFKKAGLVWFRDYAFTHDWMAKANKDGQWGGWPWYPQLIKRYTDAGVRLLACSAGGVTKIELAEDGTVKGPMEPDQDWTRTIAERVLAFDQVPAWEIDNEYDLHEKQALAEIATGWKNYMNHHQRYGQLINVLTQGKKLAVENGRAGVWPDRLRECIESGSFADIDVVNVHHYSGIEPPEVNYGNMNTGFNESHRKQEAALWFDHLREVVHVADMDGKDRQAWLTEFGWDTLAGHVVTPYQQAAYLPRGYMMILMSGFDKAFWYWHYDSPKPTNFFDGCGLLGPDKSPKLSLCSAAAMTQILPTPKPVGQINAGANTWGHVFKQGEDYVATLFLLEGKDQDQGPEVSFNAKQLYDFLGNKIEGQKATLRLAPVYAVGIDPNGPWYRQTAYDLESSYLMLATAGDELTSRVRIRNNRETPIDCSIDIALPEGWTSKQTAQSASVAPGETKTLDFTLLVNAHESLGEKRLNFVIREAGQAVKEIPLRVLVRDAVAMQVGPITTRPGDAKVSVKLINKSRAALGGELTLVLPKAWSAAQAKQTVPPMEPNKLTEFEVAFNWTPEIGLDEKAEVIFTATDGRTVRQPIIPNTITIPRAPAITFDGKLDDWSAASRLPQWMIGCDLGSPRATFHAAWAEDGLYFAAEVEDSKLKTTDPRSFWNGDCMEIFIDSADDKRHRFYEPGDHQFWVVPMIEEGRAYLGQWKRKEEIPATRYDIRDGVKSACRKTDTGYVIELFVPGQHIVKYEPKQGGRVGLNINLTVKGSAMQRQAYWPWTKSWGVQNLPKTWGTAVLGE